MIRHKMLPFVMVTSILATSIFSFFVNETTHGEATEESTEIVETTTSRKGMLQHFLSFLQQEKVNAETEELPITTMVESHQAIPAQEKPELTAEEELLTALVEWQETLPDYESETHQTNFIETIAPAAVLIANTHGIYPSVMIAQASLESSWGQSGLAANYNNLMGTKGSWKGQSVTVPTREDIDGQSVYITAGFSVYDSWAESLNRYGSLMKNGLEGNEEFYSGTWRENTSSYRDATAWLQGRYATDTAYALKLNQTIESFNLDQYDTIEAVDVELEEVLHHLNLTS